MTEKHSLCRKQNNASQTRQPRAQDGPHAMPCSMLSSPSDAFIILVFTTGAAWTSGSEWDAQASVERALTLTVTQPVVKGWMQSGLDTA